MEKEIPRIKQPKEAYIFDYAAPAEFVEKQNSVFWTAGEIEVEKDKQDMLVNMTESEQHGVIAVSKLFTRYETMIGVEHWGGVIAKRYPRPEIQMMASCFAFFELNVHAPFYAKINQELGLDTEEFYNSYVDDPVLKDRMDFIDGVLADENELVSLAAFSIIEGAVLYSSFAFLKHFQSEGKNKLMNIVRGINFSVRDENIHSEAGAWLFRQLLLESNLSKSETESIYERVVAVCHKVFEHECRIIDMIFEKGPMDGITALQMKNFVQSRLNKCLENLKMKKLYEVSYNPIASWFYKSINNFTFNDFFSGIGNSYNRKWKKTGFTWKGKTK